jgi:N-acetylmuramoyl-L-alanine amidase
VIAVVIGHRLSSQGAVNARGVTEYVFNGTLAADVHAALMVYGIESRVVERPNHRGGYSEQAANLNAMGVDAVVELHFNSASAPAATGTETLCHPRSSHGHALATAIQRSMCAVLGLRDRGVKATETNGAGVELKTLTRTHAPAVIVESYFGSNATDTERATLAMGSGSLGKAIAEGIADWEGPR